MNRRGFAYLVVVLILGLMAFMGMFLLQSSSAEYSQAAISVYRTMARQLAEAAAEEAFSTLEERFKDKSNTGFMQQLLWQASNSEIPRGGGSTGLNPTLLHDFTDLKDRVTQVLTLKDYHMTRAGFVIEKVIPSLKDLRPIDQGPLNDPANYHRSPDRIDKFDNHFSRDWYLTLQLEVTVALKKRRSSRINYTISRDIKIVNQAPMARNFTFFSILGHQFRSSDPVSVQATIDQQMNMPDEAGGRLILWNQPFQSRVYMHGPTVIALENPELALDRANFGAYNTGDPARPAPGPNQGYQYSDTFYGFSYFRTLGRAIFPRRTLWDSISVWWRGGKPDKEDKDSYDSMYPNVLDNATVYGGLIPHQGRGLLEILGNINTHGIQDTYFRGTNIHQKFLPGGPFVRTPWKYVSPELLKESPFSPNRLIPRRFPGEDDELRLEHRWMPGELSLAEESRIYSRAYKVKYNHVTGGIQSPPDRENMEFSLSYYNSPDPEGFFGTLAYSGGAILESFWHGFTMPFQAVSALASPLVRKIFGGSETGVSVSTEPDFPNMFPTAFRWNFRGLTTRKFENESQIPRDEEGRWLLDGTYWLDNFETEANLPIVYVGTGTIMVTQFTPERPFRIRSSIVSLKQPDGVTPMGHLNLFYHPFDPNAINTTERMIHFDGSNILVEASVYSCYGLRTNSTSNILDFSTVGIYHDKPMDQWEGGDNSFVQQVISSTNMIFGNYVNFFFDKSPMRGDLWVMHNINNPLYFDKTGANYSLVQNRIDKSEDERKAYEIMAHEFYMSPKIQHVSSIGGGDD